MLVRPQDIKLKSLPIPAPNDGATEAAHDAAGEEEIGVKTADLKKGELYFAEFDYGEYQVEVLEAALYTDEVHREYEDKIVLVDPPTPFDPQTGEPNPKIEEIKRQPVDKIVRKPGFRPRRGYGFYGRDEKAGIPCRVTSTWQLSRGDGGKEMLVRPQDIKTTWASHAKDLLEAEERARSAREAREEFGERVEKLKELLPSARVAEVPNYGEQYPRMRPSTSHVSVNLDELETLLLEQGAASFPIGQED